MSPAGKRLLWMVWILITLSITGYLGAAVMLNEAPHMPWLAAGRSLLVPGATTHGHYQIELACESCHTDPLGGRQAMQKACVGCHGAELKEAEDKHPLTKFLDPRNAELTSIVDATLCVTCHEEHRPQITTSMGVSMPTDFCAHCHQDIAKERPSHVGLTFDTCASAGCHNFHDNRALYEDFLLRHAEDPRTNRAGTLATRDWREVATMLPDYPSKAYPLRPLTREDIDASRPANTAAVEDWLASSHARSGVNCSACHEPQLNGQKSAWTDRPNEQACRNCHASEVEGFLSGKHGMRLAAHLPPMTPGEARLPMNSQAAHEQLGCTSCHGAHRFDTRAAAVEACLGCHRDQHSIAYKNSAHYGLWQQELSGTGASGSSVSCASCHMPRVEHRNEMFDLKWMGVQHNQNDTLQPNEKMLRPVCLQCHGLGFATDALADRALIRRNFKGQPTTHVRSIEMAVERDRRHRELRTNARPASG